MDLSTMRTIVRRELKDEDAQNYRWSNDELDRHIAHAVKELSKAIPLPAEATIATTSGSREINVSSLSDRVTIEAVEYPIDQFPPNYQQFSLWGDSVTLFGDHIPDGSNCHVYYTKLHTLDSEGSTIAPKLEDLVASGACGHASIAWSIYAINRVNVGGTTIPQDFLSWGNEKLEHFRQELERLGRKNRVRVRSLYKPYYPRQSKSTDYGP